MDGAGAGPLSSPEEPPSSSQVPDWLAKQVPWPQQLTPGDVPQAVSQSESTVHEEVHEVGWPLSSPPVVSSLDEPGFGVVSSPAAPELLPLPELLPVDASFLEVVVVPVKPDELLLEPPQAATSPTAPRPTIRNRIEPIFIGRLPSAAPSRMPQLSVDESTHLVHSVRRDSFLMLS
jgi:hypothetical protein